MTATFRLRPTALAVIAVLSANSWAVTIQVTSRDDVIADDGACTLREAIIAANEDFYSGIKKGECPAGDGADKIVLNLPGVYELSLPGTEEDESRTGDLDITEDLTIEGKGAADSFVIDAFGLDRVLDIASGITVSLANLTIKGGYLNQRYGYGGGIYARESSTIIISQVTVTENSANDSGGGLHVSRGGRLLLDHCTITKNSSGDKGGALYEGQYPDH